MLLGRKMNQTNYETLESDREANLYLMADV